ncbi:MAG: phosphate ABC transporter permease PstA [Candidatus Nanopelagicales bacterium]|nr:phosphate ABC transporter permease PstA [Candidatus Nanopelagicales bacterium]
MTTLFDPSRIPTLQQQERTRPWSKRTKKFDVSVALAVIVPLLIVVAMFQFSDIPDALVMVIYLPLQLIASGIAAYLTKGKRGIGDSLIIVNAIGASIFSFVVIISVIWSLLSHGIKALSIPFLTQNSTYISPSTPLEYGGIAHAALGTLLIVAISALIAVPIGIATAIYITEVRGRAVPYVRFFVQSMSGVPSVVAGLFILTTLILTGAINTSAFAGGLAYAILMLPTVARTAEEVLRLVPDDLRTGALALGSTRARTVFQVVLPAAKTGIVTAIILGVARVIGETAPLLMTAGKNDATVTNPFSDPISTLPVSIFENVAQPYPDAVTRAWGSALILMVVVAILFTAARLIGRNKVK